ncbi:DUF7009 family protein [Mucilaginibacter gilvus]|uniref:Uncharacterized protein n=1 Tax=Mucilaginibacter gilvus TaxID=2305909 RepID=A0A3S3Z0N2_9SPHI|nr:hypothetical protein [Mucilaginibacter gilvus]RWY50340.1 hypothetical protein EPL05_16495 [Mucilaginibacter gilvus]
MKIRIKSGSVRYRLTRSEVALFEKEGVVKGIVEIGENALIYTLQRAAEEQLSASFKNNMITLLMPENMADEWISTDQVGFAGKDGGLHLLIEKDFTCLDNVDEDQSDNYPNPLAQNRS